MALSEAHASRIRLRRVDGVGPADTVKHVDQLSECDLDALVATVDGSGVPCGTTLDLGDVVVFEDYYRVELA